MVEQVATGTVVSARELATMSGESVPIPDPQRLIHLQFRRFAGCPICNTHLQSIARRHEDITGRLYRTWEHAELYHLHSLASLRKSLKE